MSQLNDKLSRLDGVIGRLEEIIGSGQGLDQSGGLAESLRDGGDSVALRRSVEGMVDRLDDTIQRLRTILES